jgi:lysine-N-methylase
LDPGIFVRRLPSRVSLSGEASVPAAQYLHWWHGQSARWVERWQSAETESGPSAELHPDVPSVLWHMAKVAQAGRLDDESAFGAAWHALRPAPNELNPLLRALARAIETRLEQWTAWRSPDDPILRAGRAVLAATRQVALQPTVDAIAPSYDRHRAETFTVHARLHAHALVDNLPLGAALRDQAVRLLVARALPAALERTVPALAADPAADQPIALVEMLLRGHGLWSYAQEP